MAVSNPTYITKSKHGVYYFQLLISKKVAKKVGIKSLRYTRSLKTKDKRVALTKAKKIQSRFHHLIMSNGKDKINSQLDVLFEEDPQSLELAEIARKDSLIHTAYIVNKRYDQIEPKTDIAFSMFFDSLTQYEQESMQFVSDNGIVLSDYDSKSNLPTVEYVEGNKRQGLRSIEFDELVLKYLNHCKNDGCSNATVNLYSDQIQMFRDIIQVNDPLSVDEDVIDKYIEGLSKFPAFFKTGKYKNMAVDEILALNLKEGLLSKSSMKTYAVNVKAFVDWACKSKYFKQGISAPLEGAFRYASSDSYKPFTDDDLKRLFLSEPYLKGSIRKASSYWVPIIGLFTGARQNEICQLACADIKKETLDGQIVYYFDFNDEGDKTLKSSSSKRIIPIHPQLTRLGFIEFVERQKLQNKDRIFHELTEGKNGKFNDSFSKWFSRHRQKCGVQNVPGAKKVFHSFRHTVITHLRNSALDIPIENVREVVGHANKSTILTVYAPVLSLEMKNEIIKRIKFDIDFDQIRRWIKT